jgi:predicted dehydrogenase/nucleoside-diphosphate-sugar epimerase
MTKTTLRVGIVGAGYISDYHIKAIIKQSNTEFIAICDLNEEIAKKAVAEHTDVKVYTDLQKMLDEQSLDVVHVLTQPDSHFNLASVIINAGCHVLLEKPVTVNSAQAQELKSLAESNNVKLAINHNFLFSRPFNDLKSVIESGQLGPLKSVRVVWKKVLQQVNYGPWNLWMLREPHNILFETGSHSFSELLSVVCEPKSLNVKVSREKVLPSGSTFYRRWNVTGRAEDVSIQIETSFDQGYEQHYIEVEGMFGVAKADIENDVFTTELPTGLTYDAERLNVNAKAGLSIVKQAFRTYLSYGLSKFSKSASGAPYETSMLNGIQNCYDLILGNRITRGVTIEFAIEIAKLAEKVKSKMPKKVESKVAFPQIPPTVNKPNANCKILIIGASGFIGKKLLEKLIEQNKSVRAMVRNPSALVGLTLNDSSEILIGDFRNSELMESALSGIETVYHLAVAHSNSLTGYLKADSEPTIKLAELCIQKRVKRFIYTGTIDSLYLGPGAGVIKDNDGVDSKITRRNNYAHSKAITESKLNKLSKEQGFPLVVIRPAIVLGKGGPINHVGVANWFGLGRCDFWGNGNNNLPLVLAEDVVAGLIAAEQAEGIIGKTYNLSAESCISARDYVCEIEKVLGSKIAIGTTHHIKLYLFDMFKWLIKVIANHPDKSRIPSIRDWRCREQHAAFDTSQARKDLNWTPESNKDVIIEKGIHEPAKMFLES